MNYKNDDKLTKLWFSKMCTDRFVELNSYILFYFLAQSINYIIVGAEWVVRRIPSRTLCVSLQSNRSQIVNRGRYIVNSS